MSKYAFSMQDNGYSTQEVDRYIESLQCEYRNAVAWAEEIENKGLSYDEAKELKNMIAWLENENKMLKDENGKLVSDCRILASRLRTIINKEPDHDPDTYAASSITKDAQEKAVKAVRNAEQKAKSILETVEKECQSIIQDAIQQIEETKTEIRILDEKKHTLTAEIDKLSTVKNDMTRRIEQAKHLLDN